MEGATEDTEDTEAKTLDGFNDAADGWMNPSGYDRNEVAAGGATAARGTRGADPEPLAHHPESPDADVA